MPDGTGAVASAAGSASSGALGAANAVIGAITSLGGLALSIWGDSGDKQVWTADMFKGVANNGKYTADEATLFGIGASIIIVIIVVILLILMK